MGEAWSWFGDCHADLPHKIAYRTGQVFKLNNDRRVQFSRCHYRGYVNEDGTAKNPFLDKTYDVAFKEYKSRNSERIEKQKARKAKKEEKMAKKEERKRKRALKRSKKKLSNKSKRRQCGGNQDLGVQVKNKRIKTECDLGVIKDEPVDEKKSMHKENKPAVKGLFKNIRVYK